MCYTNSYNKVLLIRPCDAKSMEIKIKMNTITLLVCCFMCLCCSVIALHIEKLPSASLFHSHSRESTQRSRSHVPRVVMFKQSSTARRSASAHYIIANVETKQKLDLSKVVAKGLGYSLGVGAMAMYTPILFKLITSKDSSGFALSTWIMNVIGTLLAIAYPIKRGFPFSTYVELSAILLQLLSILAISCYYRGLSIAFSAIAVPSIALFTWFVNNPSTSEAVMKSLQISSIAVCTAATLPQILLTFQRRQASWSWLTALLSTTGCLARIYTTLQLTGDRTALVGYALGAVMNGILLGQVLWYNHLKLA